ncbi:MAG: peptidylprolyl isomerase, partial [Gammaproteobacteria bacterium]|nr:peptidylprolyl isomerase [Gammaproteobacteria bacterium]
MQLDTSRSYQVSIETDRGTIELELYPQHAPKTV